MKKTHLGPKRRQTRRLGPFCLCGPALAFVGCRWLPWAFVGLRWPLVVVVGCYGLLLSIKWMKKNEKNTPMAQATPDASFGPFLSSWACVGLRWPSLAAVGLRGPALAAVGRRWPSLAVIGCHGLSWACVGLRWLLWAFVSRSNKNQIK